jgi:hypothetical protein
MLVLATIALLIALLVYVVWRHRRYIDARRKFEPLLPAQNQLSWQSPTNPLAAKSGQLIPGSRTKGFSSKTGFTDSDIVQSVEFGKDAASGFIKRPSTLGAAADGAVAGAALIHAALSIDPHVVNAIEFSTAGHLRGVADLDKYVHDHFFVAPIHSADGWFERLTGYVAEQKAAAYLESTGHHIEFAPVPNQPVWDMLVDGHPVQVKEGLAGVKDFLADHANIPVYTGSEVTAAVKDPAVDGLDILNKDAVEAATRGALDNIQRCSHS